VGSAGPRGEVTGASGGRGPAPPPVVPFAVRPTPEARADLWRLDRPLPPHVDDDGPATLVRFDREVPDLVAEGRARLAADPAPWTSAAADLPLDAAEGAGWELAAAVSATHPGLAQVDDRGLLLPGVGVRVDRDGHVTTTRADLRGDVGGDPQLVVSRLAAVPAPLRAVEAVALGIAEDVVLVDAAGRAVWSHVLAPSGWDPGASGGTPLAALHAPVPTSDRLIAASANLARAIVRSGPHVRWVWGLSDDPAAAHHPRRPPPPRPRPAVADLTFRAERQTTLPCPALDLGVFLIRVHRARLADVIAPPGRRARLAATVRSLPDALAAYKGVADRRGELLRWLEDG
jgi:dimethylamine monooxygenase subunit A